MADRATAKRTAAGRGTALRVVPSPARRPKKSPAAAARTSVILLLVSAALLTTIGVVEVFSASSVYAFTNYDNSFWFLERQAIYAAIGIGALLLTARMRYTAWRRLSGPLVVVAVVLLLLALHPTAGSSVYGASRWIGLGPLTLQPAEFAKLALIAFSAAVLAQKERKLDDWLHLALPLGPVVLLVAAIVMLQRDLGTTTVIVGSVLMMLFVAGARLRHLLVTGVITLGGLSYLIFGEAYRRARFLSFFDPWKDPLSNGYQLIQGLIALGSGGWLGVGLGASRQKWAYLPNAHTDFIFAVLGEELGLLGEFVVIVSFGVMIYAGIRIAVRAPDTFGRLLAAGITSWIGLQAIVNLGAVTGLLPITGVPLPFVSFGGSALIVTLGAVGVLASIARAGAGSRAGGLRAASSRTSEARRTAERKRKARRSRTSTRRAPA